jgi:hypothetical protein
LSGEAFENLKSQNATSSSTWGGRRKLPLVFTEQGALQAANALNSPRANKMGEEGATPGKLKKGVVALCSRLDVVQVTPLPEREKGAVKGLLFDTKTYIFLCQVSYE